MLRSYTLCCAALLTGTLGMAVSLKAQTGDNAYFQDSTVIGSTNAISVTRLPVTAGGVTYYWDLALPFQVDGKGDVSVGPLTMVKSPKLIVSNFVKGTYVGPPTILGGNAKIVLTGPGIVDGNYTEWTVSSAMGADNCTYPESAAFFVGPLTANPIYPRLKAANITSTDYSYGTGSSSNCNGAWPVNGIIGVSQVENTLTFSSFTYNGGTDSNIPLDQITYTLVPAK